MKNVALLRKVRDHIAERPWEWDQTEFYRPVSYTVELKRRAFRHGVNPEERFGHSLETLEEKVEEQDFTCGSAFCVCGWAAYFDGWTPQSDTDVEAIGTAALGLNPIEAEDLFDGSNNFETVMSLLDKYIKEAELEETQR